MTLRVWVKYPTNVTKAYQSCYLPNLLVFVHRVKTRDADFVLTQFFISRRTLQCALTLPFRFRCVQCIARLHLHSTTFACMGKTVIVGASPNPGRYSYIATQRLKSYGEEVFPVGIREGHIGGDAIYTNLPMIEDVDTITLYVGPNHQAAWVDYMLGLQPKRVIFNPGTENPALERKLQAAGIETEIACTLVLLSTNSYDIA